MRLLCTISRRRLISLVAIQTFPSRILHRNCDIKHVCIIKVYLVKYVNSHIRHWSPWGKESRIIFVIKFKLNKCAGLLALVVLLCGYIHLQRAISGEYIEGKHKTFLVFHFLCLRELFLATMLHR